ncbi:hypothetical protein LZ575_15990 [Antarcticibacterium sp. 1MA-6-2]|uniref:hypothetical protein n=1 Tax=Antarcticibacterium sp. 1MA-6-2 TaxID=2908210 RepID=UPI001F24D409|nr:hypothetical protein [Antarcticibacterium sp. 1MA-6-2]UJH90336.1 hypothetical protein LZ575_15990 [Antarcticibacterium sp. 1MA-6-2]
MCLVYSQFNRNLGFEYNLASPDNKWTGKAMVLKSFSPNNSDKNFVHAANLKYTSGNLSWNWRHEYVAENFTAEVGYVPRSGYYKINPSIGYLFFPKSKTILNHGPVVSTMVFFNKQMEYTESLSLLEYNIRFRSQSLFTLWGGYDYVQLQQPFDPTNFSGYNLLPGSEHLVAWCRGKILFQTPKPLHICHFFTIWRVLCRWFYDKH